MGLEIAGSTVLVTGGATGIGFALAEKLLNEGCAVIVCGRREAKLRAAKKKLPSLNLWRCDISVESERRDLFRWTTRRFPNLNILINNAGIQRQVDFRSPKVSRPLNLKNDEVAINLTSTIRLCALFTPRLLKKSSAAIVNVSSGLTFVPIATMPVYCATKAAIHSFTLSLRHQLKGSSVKVFEAIPPTTDTELDASFAGETEQEDRGITPQEVATAVIEGLRAGTEEIRIGQAEWLYQAALKDPHAIFTQLND